MKRIIIYLILFLGISLRAQTCLTPNIGAASNITASSADLNWTSNGSETQWDIEYGPQGFDPGDGTLISGISAMPYTLSGLSSSSTYAFRVRASCGAGVSSNWSNLSNAFSTSCAAVSAPYNEGFDNTGSDVTDYCWTFLDRTTNTNSPSNSRSTSQTFVYSGTGVIFIFNGTASDGSITLISPRISDLDNTKQLSFYKRNFGGNLDFVLGTMADPTDTSTFTPLDTGSTSSSYTKYDFIFNNYSGTDEYIAIRIAISPTNSYFMFDEFVYETAPTCLEPTSLAVTNVSTNSADLSWTANSGESQWDIEYGSDGFSLGSGSRLNSITGNPYSLSGLNAQASYDYYVRADCGAGDFSAWAGPFNFNTLCNSISLPYTENFDAATSILDACWSSISTNPGATLTHYVGSSFANSNPSSVYYLSGSANSGDLILVSPELSNLDNQKQVRFSVRRYFGSASDLIVGTLSDPADASTFTPEDTIFASELTSSYQEFTVLFSNHNGSDKFVGFAHGLNYSGSYLFVDDFIFEEVPSCPPVTDVTASSIGSSSLNLSWTPGGNETAWDIEYGAPGFSLGSGTLVSNITTNSNYTLSGLSASTPYQIYVRADCAPGDSSRWVGPLSLTTSCAAFTAPYTQNFDGAGINSLDPCWSFLNETAFSSSSVKVQTSSIINNSAPYAAFYFNSAAQNGGLFLVSPQFSDLSSDKQISFYYARYSGGASDLIVGTMADPNDSSTFNALDTIPGTSALSSFQQYSLPLNNHNGSDQYVAIRHGLNASNSYMVIDDFNYEDQPNCRPPINLSVSSSNGEAEVSWTAGNNETQWDLEWGPSGFSPGNGTLISGTGASPYTITGLNIGSSYDVYLRSDCGGGVKSSWSNALTFTAQLAPINGVSCGSGLSVDVFNDNLESNNGWTGNIGNSTGNWKFPNSSINTLNTGPLNPYNGSNWAEFQASSIAFSPRYFVSPPIDLSTASSEVELSFYLYAYGSSVGTLNVQVGTSPSGSFTTVFSHSGQIQNSYNGNWEPIGVDLDAYAGQTIYVRFSYASAGGNSNGDIAIDQVKVQACVSCPGPTGLSASNEGANSVDLDWTNGASETQWDIEYGPRGYSRGSGTLISGVTTKPYTLTGLTSQTDYDLYLRADCSGGDYSTWTGPLEFRTTCAGFTAPYTQNFDGTTDPEIDECWSVITPASSAWVRTENSFSDPQRSGTNSVEFYFSFGSGDLIFVSPEFTDLDTAKQISFWYQNRGISSYASDLIVGTLSDPEDPTTFSPLDTILRSEMNANWKEYVFQFTHYQGTDKYIGLKHGKNTSYDYFWIDDFSYRNTPNCPEPSSLAQGFTTGNTIELSWTAGGTETQWELEYGPVGFNRGSGTSVSANTQPYTLSGLSPSSDYDVYLRANCGNGDLSNWVGPLRVSTPCIAINNFPSTETFDATTALPNCWEHESSNNENWIIASSASASTNSDVGGSGNFAYVDDSYPYQANPAGLITNGYDLSALSSPELSFWFQNRASSTSGDPSELHLDVHDGTSWNNDVLIIDSDVFEWSQYFVDLSPYKSAYVKLRFRAFEYQSGNASDASIDEVKVAEFPACPDPLNPMLSQVTGSQATVSWTNRGTNTNWDIEYGPSNFSLGSGTTLTGVNTNPYVLSGLAAETNYELYIRANCGTNGNSNWVGPVAFTTGCADTSAPFFVDFESFPSLGLDRCWTEINQANSNGLVRANSSSNNYSGARILEIRKLSATQGFIGIVSPRLSDLDQTKQISFWYSESNAVDNSGFVVGTMSNPDDTATFSPLDTVLAAELSTGWQEFYYAFDSYTGNDKYIAIKIHQLTGNFNDRLYFDDFHYEAIPSCFPPHSIHAVDISGQSIELNWLTRGNENQWDLEYGPRGFSQGNGNTISSITSRPYTLSGLSPQTDYDIYIRSNCGGGDMSAWSKIELSTGCLAITAPYVQDFDATTDPNIDPCWTQISETDFGNPQARTYSSFRYNGTNSLRLYSLNDIRGLYAIVSPQIGDLDSSRRVRFYYAGGNNEDSDIIFGTMSDPEDTSSFKPLDTIPNTQISTSWQEYEYSFENYQGSDEYVVIAHGLGDIYETIYIDNFRYDRRPNCPEPSALSQSFASDTSITFTWTENASATSWLVEYGAVGFTPGSGTDTLVNTKPATISGLAAGSSYDVYLRSYCFIGDTSTLVGPLTVTTACSPVGSFPYLQSFDAASTPQCWDQASNNTEDWVFTGFSSRGAGFDHTGNNGRFAYIDDSNGDFANPASLISAPFDLSSLNSPELIFWFANRANQLNGPASTLYVDVYDGSNWNLAVMQIDTNVEEWTEYLLDLSGFSSSFTLIRFRGLESSGPFGFNSDLSLDDVLVQEAPSCRAPRDLSITNVTASSVELNWFDLSAQSDWIVEYGPAGFNPGSGTMVSMSTKPYILSGLTGNTSYDVYLRAYCGPGDSSEVVGPESFTTACGSYTAPYSQAFDGTSDPNIDACWTVLNNTGNSSNYIQTDDHFQSPKRTAPNAVKFRFTSAVAGVTNGLLLVSPPFTDLDNTKLVSFYYQNDGEQSDIDDLIFGTMTDPNDTATFNALDTIRADEMDGTWKQYTYVFTNYSGSDQYVAIAHALNKGSEIFIDDFSYENQPSCNVPSDLQASTITNSSATLSWTDWNATSPQAYEITYGPAGFSLGNGLDTVLSSSASFTLNNLSGNSAYDFYVRSNCAPNDSSAWSLKGSFLTQCDPFTAPYTQNFDNTNSPEIDACWTAIEQSPNNGAEVVTSTILSRSNSNSVLLKGDGNNPAVLMLVSPKFSDLDQTKQFSFYYSRRAGFSMVSSLIVGTMTDPGDTSTFTALDTILNSEFTTSWQKYESTFLNYTGNDQYIALKHGFEGAFDGIYLDDFTYEFNPTCFKARNIQYANLSDSSVQISWDPFGSANAWIIEYGPQGFSKGSGTMLTATNSPYTLNGLNEASSYDLYLRSYCGPGDTSEYPTAIQFTSPCRIKSSFPYSETFDSFQAHNTGVNCGVDYGMEGCWENEASADNANWVTRSVATFSNSTGPSTDFSGNGNYLFVEGAGCFNNQAQLYSPYFDFTSLSQPRISFAYHMYGSDMGSLDLYYSTDSGSTWTNTGVLIDGDQGNQWHLASTVISSLGGEDNVVFRFTANLGSGAKSDIAIDEFLIEEAPAHDLALIDFTLVGDPCGTNQVLSVDIQNLGASNETSLALEYDVNGTIYSEVWNGNLSPGDTDRYTFTNTFDASNAGNYNVVSYVNQSNDSNANNDSLRSTISTPAALTPSLRVDFESGLPSGWTTSANVGMAQNASSNVLHQNLSSNNQSFYLNSPRFNGLSAGDVFRLAYRYVSWPTGQNAHNLGAGDTLKVLISTDCGASFNNLDLIHAGTHTPSTVLSLKEYDLSAYAGQTVVIRVEATWGSGNYALNIDELYLGTPLGSSLSINAGISCNGASDGEIIAFGQGGVAPYSYQWQGSSSTSNTYSALPVGKRFITITDAQGYTIVDSITLSEPDPIQVSISSTNAACAGSNGSIDLSVTGGTAPYNFAWSDGPATTEDRNNLAAGIYTFTITDANGCVYSATDTVLAVDDVAPVAQAQNISVYLDANGQFTLTGADIDNGSTDNCGISSIVPFPSNLNCSHLGSTTVALVVTDFNSNQDTAYSTVTVIDTIKPNAVCTNLNAYLDASGNVSISGSDVGQNSSDNCSINIYSLSQTNFTCADEGPNNLSLTISDPSGNQSSCNATVTVLDTISPSAVCQNLTVYLDANGQASITANDVDNGSSDNCTVSNLSVDRSSFSCADLGTNIISLMVTDQAGNQTSCSSVITVMDTIRPTAVCQDLTIYLDANGQASITADEVDNGSSDNCSLVSKSISKENFSCADLGVNQINFTVTDTANNQSTCVSTVTVVDTISPIVQCQDLTLYLDANGSVSLSPSQVDNGSSDNCSISSLDLDKTSFACADEGTNQVSLTAIDPSGNQSTCNATITIVDTISPSAVCQNLTVYLDANGQASITANDVDNGSSDNCTVSNLSIDRSSFTCADLGTNTISLMVTDQAGNQSSCSSVITVMDTIRPTAVCQDLTIYLDANGQASITADEVDNGSSDNCSLVSKSISKENFGCADLGVNQINFTVTDTANNQSTCVSTVTVVDTISPIVQCQDLTLYLDANGSVSLSPSQVDNGSSDNCSISSLDLDKTSFACADEGINQVSLTAIDPSGNQSTCNATITIVDTISPSAVCQNLTVYLDANGQASITANDVDNGSSDNCTVSSLSLDRSSFTCADLGTNTISLMVTDQAGNQSSCSSVITVMDTISPQAQAQNLTVYLDGNGAASISVSDVDNGSSDNCSIVSRTLSEENFSCADLGSNTISLDVEDQSGNQSSALATITVMDTISPTVLCQNITIYLDNNGNANIVPAAIDSGSSDNCSITELSLSDSSFTCAEEGINTVTLTASDAAGNQSTCQAQVTVLDTISPLVVTNNVTVYLDGSGQGTIVASMLNNGSGDACGIASMSVDRSVFSCGDLGNNTVYLTVTDVNGNSSRGSAIVEVRDTIGPEARSRDITVYLDSSGTVSVLSSSVNNGSSDNCGITASLSQSVYGCGDEGLNQDYLIVRDADGNVDSTDFLITVRDTLSPEVITRDITVQLGSTGLATISPNQLDSASSDNCSNQLFYTASKTSFSCTDLGSNTVELTATDVHGNSTSRTAQVLVEDNIAPLVQTQSVLLNLDGNGQAVLTASQVNNGSSDNCGIDSLWISPSSFDCSDLGANSVTLYARDAIGNQNSAVALVTVRDVESPQAQSQDLTVYLDATGVVSISASDVDNGSSDNCSIASISLDRSTFSCADVGANTVTLSVSDASGNTHSSTATITVLDTISPLAQTQDITISLDGNGQASITAADINDGSSDGCGVSSVTVSPSSFSCSDLGANTVVLTVSDNHGNTSQQTATVRVEDNRAPVVMVQSATVYLDGTGTASLSVNQVNNGSSDNCGITSYSLSQTSFGCSDLGNTTVVLTASDGSGNSATAAATISVLDTISPVLSAQNATVYLDASGSGSLSVGAVDNGSSDNCSLSSLSVSKSAFSCADVGTNTVSLSGQDGSGNSATSSVTVTVLDTIRPQVSTRSISIGLDATGQASLTAADINDGSSDACGLSSLTVSPSSFSCNDLGFNTVVLTVTDNHGNSAQATAQVTVEDNRAPQAIAQNTTLYLDGNGNASLSASQLDNGSSDNCGISSYSLSQTSFDCGDLGNTTVVLTVVDGSGNSANTAATVTVLDTVSPVVVSQNTTVYLDASGSVSLSAGTLNNGSSDNCSVSMLSVDQTSFGCGDVGPNTVLLSLTDGSGNTATGSATVTVLDTISPTVQTQNLSLALDATGQASLSASMVDAGSSDACGLASMSVDQTSFDCSDLGANTVVLSLTDNHGNSGQGQAIVTVVDNLAPVASAQNVTVYLDVNGQASVMASAVDNGSSDNCGIMSYSLSQSSFGCNDLGANPVTLSVSDGSGNSSTASATVTVLDTVSPVLTTQNITAYLDANGVVSISASAVDNGSGDNCSISSYALSQTSFTCGDVGPNTVILTGTDGSGNSSTASATVTVVDTISPTAVAQNISVSLDANGQVSITASNVAAGSSDACGIASMTVSPSSFSCADLGANTVVLTVTDIHGNSSTASSTVTVLDNTAPTVLTQAHTVYLDASGTASISTTDINNGSSDNCTIASYSLNVSSFDCSNVGQNLVTLTATDGAGNSGSSGAIVTVLDTIRPSVANPPGNITAYSNGGSCGTTVTWPTVNGTDNCSVSSVTASIPSGSFFNTGTTTVVLTAQDPSGNSGSSSFTVTVLDTIAPVFTSGVSNIAVSPNANSCDATVSWTAPTATDNCSGVSYSSSHASGSIFPLGNTPVTITATDADGNSRTISFTVTVNDVVAPSLSNVPSNLTVGNDAGQCGAVVNYPAATVSDNCSGASLSSSHPSGTIFPVGTTTVVLTATDGAGNTATASFDITVEDQEAPVFTSMPSSDTVGQCGQLYTFVQPTGSDNCTSLPLVRQIGGLPSGSVYPPGVTTNTFEISDGAGNTTTASFSIVVVPQGQPQLPSLIEACENDPAVNITLGQNIFWSGNGIVNNGTSFDPGSAGTGRHVLSYVFTDSMSCNVSGTITVTVLPKPLTPVITKVGSTTLETGVYNTYQWYRDGVAIAGANGQTYTYSQSGNYQVEVSNTVGCFTYSAGYVVGSSGGGIGLQELDLEVLEVYPNPSDGRFTVALNVASSETLDLSLYSLDGRKVYQSSLQTDLEGKVQVDVGHLPTANYFLYIRSSDQVAVVKMLMK